MLVICGICLITLFTVETDVLHLRFYYEWEDDHGFPGLESMQQYVYLRSKGQKLTMPSVARLSRSDNSLSAILQRHPSRIPGYAPHSNATLFGYVMRDFASRVLSRHIFSVTGPGADVLVVSKDDVAVMDATDDTTGTSLSFRAVGPGFVRHAMKQGHNVHTLSRLEDASWQMNNEDTAKMPSWILLAVFDPPHGMEDNVLTSEAATSLLSECTVTYIVYCISASQKGLYGARAADDLIRSGYKVQVLSTSHFVRGYLANTLLDTNSSKSVAKLLRLGWAQSVEGKTKGNDDGEDNNMFHAYLFATQGLDLAIPSQREYLDLKSGHSHVYFNATSHEALIPMKQCMPSSVRIAFMHSPTDAPTLDHFHITCNGVQVTATEVKRLWMSAESADLSEAACVSVSSLFCVEGSACTTRVLPNTAETPFRPQDSADDNPNLLLLMIDPISQPLFKQTLPKTRDLLQDMGFVSFEKYTVVGDNSGPNQAALYSGLGLVGRTDISSQQKDRFQWIWDDLRQKKGYETFKAEDGCIRNSNMVASIQPNTTHGSVLHEMNCFDFQRPNCIGHEPAAEHLMRYVSQFITEYSKRGAKWAAFASFVDSHEDTMSLALSLDEPFHNFLSGLSGPILNNTMILLVSDHGLHYGPFLQSQQGARERARPVLQMFLPQMFLPRRYRNSQKTIDTLRSNARLWVSPFDVYLTLRHVLLDDVGHPSQSSSSLLLPLGTERQTCHGTKAIPKRYCDLFDNTTQTNSSSDSLAEMDSPPSMLSFFADIPRTQKYQKQECGASKSPPDLFEKSIPSDCLCSTSHRDWHSCEGRYPWDDRSSSYPHEFAALVDCPRRDLHFDLRLVKDEKILSRLNRTKTKTKTTGRKPNILFIEIDSVSVAHADRHFHRTRELLGRYRIHKNAENTFRCASGLCAVEFSRFSLTGPNSITNQVSAWSGCITTPATEMCERDRNSGICNDPTKLEYGLRHYKTFGLVSSWCHVDTNADAGSPSKSPLIFDVARDAGYVTLFGEEFCFEDSPYVTQGNVFNLEADVMIHRVHCAIATRYARKHNITYDPGDLWTVESYHEPCVDGALGSPMPWVPLELLRQMWTEYRDEPKFAFLNAMAAHDYSLAFSLSYLNAEAYDDMMHDFLKEMLESPEASNTVIIVRSDHGNQGWANPSSVEYANQIEHRRPWIELVVPENLESISLEAIYTNQERLVNNVDLYTTLRHLIAGDAGQAAELKPPVPDWSRNFLQTIVDPGRSCREARSSPEHCRRENEVTSTAPTYGICNPYDEGLIFCEKDGRRVHGRRTTTTNGNRQGGDGGNAGSSAAALFPKSPSTQERAKLLRDFTKSIVDAATDLHDRRQS